MRDTDILTKFIVPAWLTLAIDQGAVPTLDEVEVSAAERAKRQGAEVDGGRLRHWARLYEAHCQRIGIGETLSRQGKRAMQRLRKELSEADKTARRTAAQVPGQMTMAL